jgi:ankyrin repeat protein
MFRIALGSLPGGVRIASPVPQIVETPVLETPMNNSVTLFNASPPVSPAVGQIRDSYGVNLSPEPSMSIILQRTETERLEICPHFGIDETSLFQVIGNIDMPIAYPGTVISPINDFSHLPLNMDWSASTARPGSFITLTKSPSDVGNNITRLDPAFLRLMIYLVINNLCHDKPAASLVWNFVKYVDAKALHHLLPFNDINSQAFAENALIYAVGAENLDLINTLLDTGISLENVRWKSYLLESFNKELGQSENLSWENPLEYASNRRNLPLARLLLARGAKPSTRSIVLAIRSKTHRAREVEDTSNRAAMELVQALVDAGGDITLQCEKYWQMYEQPLFVAALEGNLDVVNFILTIRAAIHPTVVDEALNITIEESRRIGYATTLEIAKVLVDAGAHISSTSTDCPIDKQPLYLAACKGNLGVVNFLLTKRGTIQPTIINKALKTAINNSGKIGSVTAMGIVKALVDAGADIYQMVDWKEYNPFEANFSNYRCFHDTYDDYLRKTESPKLVDLAVLHNQSKIVEYLISAGARPSPSTLALAVRKENTYLIKSLLKPGGQLNMALLEFYPKSLILAAKKSREASLRYLIRLGRKNKIPFLEHVLTAMEIIGPSGNTKLFEAIYKEVRRVKIPISYTNDLQFIAAIKRGHFEFAKELLGNGWLPESTKTIGTAISLLIQAGEAEIFKILIHNIHQKDSDDFNMDNVKSNLSMLDNYDRSFKSRGKIEIIKYLAKCGFSISPKWIHHAFEYLERSHISGTLIVLPDSSHSGRSVETGHRCGDLSISATMRQSHKDYSCILELLESCGDPLNTNDEVYWDKFLSTLTKSKDRLILRHVLDRYVRSFGLLKIHNHLRNAAERDDIELAQILLEAGGDPDYTLLSSPFSNNLMNTKIVSIMAGAAYKDISILSQAVRHDDTGMLQLLVNAGASPENSYTLESAAIKSNISAVQAILAAYKQRYGACRQRFGIAALIQAIQLSNFDISKKLLIFGVNPILPILNAISGRCESALDRAIRVGNSGNLQMLRLILERGEYQSLGKFNGSSISTHAILVAIRSKNLPALRLLISKGADFSKYSRVDSEPIRTPLQSACAEGFVDGVLLLLESGANVNAPPCADGGATPLQFAAIYGHAGIAIILLEKRADVNASAASIHGRTALEGAAEHGRIETVRVLLENGVSLEGRSFSKALKFAKQNKHFAVHRLLESAQASITCRSVLEHTRSQDDVDVIEMEALSEMEPPEGLLHQQNSDLSFHLMLNEIQFYADTESDSTDTEGYSSDTER